MDPAAFPPAVPVLHLIKMWLEAPVEETDRRGRTSRTTGNRKQKRGTPQGAPISPLLSNLDMRRFVLGWKVLGHEQRLDAHIVNDADDFVICCRGTADQAMRQIMDQLRLTVNEQKTRQCLAPDESFDFLGYTIGRCYSPQTGQACIGTRPSKQKITRLCREISEMTSRRWTLLPVEDRCRSKIAWRRSTASEWVGRTTSVWGRSAKPIAPWIGMCAILRR